MASHLHSRLVTVHGLDFGIPAEMTAFPAFPGLCITARVLAWEPQSCKLLLDRRLGSWSFKDRIPKGNTMDLPKFNETFLPILEILSDGKEINGK